MRYVGKEGGGPQMPQEEINRLLVEHARAGRTVVRLKGGDPFVFGRGGEEALVCREAGIPVEVVPGITAGVAAPAYAGIPVTHRDLASGVAFVTGHEDPSKPESALDWPALAAFPGTLVFYMGVRALPRIAERLIACGRSAAEPAAVVERGTLPGQRTLRAPLGELAARAASEGIRAPAVTVVGPVVALRDELAWLEDRPLHGRTVAVTRARAQASALAARLRALGATVVEAPAIRTAPLPAELPDLAGYDLVCVTSPNGAHELFARLDAAGLDARALAGRRVAAIGPGTARALRRARDPRRRRAGARGGRGARGGAGRRSRSGARCSCAGARGATCCPTRCGRAAPRSTCWCSTRRWPSRSTRPPRAPPRAPTTSRSRRPRPCASSSRPRAPPDGPRIASIGPATSAALREAGLEPALEADPHTPDGALVARAGRRRLRLVIDEARHAAHGLRHGGRVRRRAARRHRARGARRAGHRHHARDPARRTSCAAR